MVPEEIWRWAQLKGITVVGTGDATHPGWLAELEEKLEPAGNGLFVLKAAWRRPEEVPGACRADVFFMLSAEISCIYRKNGRTRKVHCLVFFPDTAGARRLSDVLSKVGSVASDGRPILKLDAADLLRMVLDISDDALFVPAHAWTPHYSVFGAASGFDSLEECFGDLAPHVSAIETGLSSDPAMNRRVSGLDGLTLISNSDAHSPSRMGREANVFAAGPSYSAIRRAIVSGAGGATATIEFFPEEGKYHYDGHAACGVRLAPAETMAHGYLCPVCGRKLTVGVAHRVELLADRPAGAAPGPGEGFRAVIPLAEILAEVARTGASSKVVRNAYMRLLSALGGELTVLLDAPLDDIAAASTPLTAEAVDRVRRGEVHISPGYDGRYGSIKIFDDDSR
jgi:uncharacterized protein (TIGR00375 family)